MPAVAEIPVPQQRIEPLLAKTQRSRERSSPAAGQACLQWYFRRAEHQLPWGDLPRRLVMAEG